MNNYILPSFASATLGFKFFTKLIKRGFMAEDRAIIFIDGSNLYFIKMKSKLILGLFLLIILTSFVFAQNIPPAPARDPMVSVAFTL